LLEQSDSQEGIHISPFAGEERKTKSLRGLSTWKISGETTLCVHEDSVEAQKSKNPLGIQGEAGEDECFQEQSHGCKECRG